MKLLNEKKFLAEIHPISPTLGKVNIALTSLGVKRILSKHLKDLPAEKKHLCIIRECEGEVKGYNQCLKDCDETN